MAFCVVQAIRRLCMEQSKAKQSKAKQSKAKQSKAKQSKRRTTTAICPISAIHIYAKRTKNQTPRPPRAPRPSPVARPPSAERGAKARPARALPAAATRPAAATQLWALPPLRAQGNHTVIIADIAETQEKQHSYMRTSAQRNLFRRYRRNRRRIYKYIYIYIQYPGLRGHIHGRGGRWSVEGARRARADPVGRCGRVGATSRGGEAASQPNPVRDQSAKEQIDHAGARIGHGGAGGGGGAASHPVREQSASARGRAGAGGGGGGGGGGASPMPHRLPLA